jgi:uncharacterized protein HemX
MSIQGILMAVDGAPVDLLGCVLVIVCGLLVAAVCWLAKTVVQHSSDLAALQAKDQAEEQACKDCRAEMDRRIDDSKQETDRRFSEIKDWMESIAKKLDRVLGNINPCFFIEDIADKPFFNQLAKNAVCLGCADS